MPEVGRSTRGEGCSAAEAIADRNVQALIAALKFYADEESWHLPDDPMTTMTPAEEDRGERARRALGDV